MQKVKLVCICLVLLAVHGVTAKSAFPAEMSETSWMKPFLNSKLRSLLGLKVVLVQQLLIYCAPLLHFISM